MKKSIAMPVIGAVAALAVVALVFMFVKMTGEPEPTAKDVPDYSKMTPAEVSTAYAKSKAAEQEALHSKK